MKYIKPIVYKLGGAIYDNHLVYTELVKPTVNLSLHAVKIKIRIERKKVAKVIKH
ncbi:MAG TPA: hypothetical protein VF679_01550 [Pedobacter sp.]|jgi:hypothetical protein